MKNISLFVLVFIASFVIFPSKTFAQLSFPPKTSEPPYSAVDGQDAFPEPYVGCSDVRDPEFHSLRPYQASPCFEGVTDYATICANILYYDDTVEVPCDKDYCTVVCEGGQATCYCRVVVFRNFYVNAFDAELPIMGNTEDEVTNSQNTNIEPPGEGIDHYAKVNEYASWYLNGVNQRTEYDPPNPDTEIGQKLITSFSGPIKKLLSYENLGFERNQQIERAGKSGSSEFDDGGRHDEIITCKAGDDAVSCYTSSGSPIRITDNEKMPLMSEKKYDNNFDKYRKDFSEWFEDNMPFYQYIPLSSTEDRKGDVHINIFKWTEFTGDITSISNDSWTVDRPIYLFFSHMEEARELADQLQRTYLSVELMKEKGDYHTIDALKKKHVVIPDPPECDLKRVRTNPGDTLAPGGTDSPVDMPVHLTYTAELECTVPATGGGGDVDEDCYKECMDSEGDYSAWPGGQSAYCKWSCGGETECIPQGTCEGMVKWKMDLKEYMPLADEDYKRLVGSPQSPFQRLFPLIHPGGYPLQGIWDMPGYSGVDYEATLTGGNYLGSYVLTDKENPANIPDPLKLFYPHIGTIHQYFLNCIQTALRPKGYGPYCPRGEPCPCEHGDSYEPTPTTDPADPGETQTPTPPGQTSTPPPVVTGPFPSELECADVLPYEDYLVISRGPDGVSNTTDDWPSPTELNYMSYDYDYQNEQCSLSYENNMYALCFAYYRIGGHSGCEDSFLSDWQQVQSAAVNAGINPIFVLSLAAHESAFGCISEDYLGAYGDGTIEEQIQKLLDWINGTNSLEELLCVWRSGYTGLEFCPPFCSKYDLENGGCAIDPKTGLPMTSDFPDGMRFWLQIFTLGQAGGCAISWL